jgi:hypothetical protein
MISKILQMWNCTLHDNELTSVPVPEQKSVLDCHTTQPEPDIKVCEADEVGCQFTDWFYSLLN